MTGPDDAKAETFRQGWMLGHAAALTEVDETLNTQAEECLAEGSTERADRYRMAAAFLRMRFAPEEDQ